MKRKKQSPEVSSDIRSFFASPPVTKKNAKPNSPKAGGRRVSLGVDTPATAAATPSPAVDPAKKEIQTPSPSPIASGTTAAKSPASIASCSPEVIAVVAERVCTLGSGRESRVLPRREVISLAESPRNGNKREVGKIDTEGSVSGVVLRRRAAHLAASAAAAAGPSGGSSSGEDNKENKVIKRVKSSSVDTKARLARPVLRAPEMSGYFLQGPISAKRDSEGHSGGSRSGSQGTVDVAGTQTRPSSMYALPVGEVVVGRDSVRDSNPTNKNKLRMGVDKQEEGVSRSQATLAVAVTAGRVLVTNSPKAMNPVRIVRWARYPGLEAAGKATKQGKSAISSSKAAAAAAAAAVTMLAPGEQGYVYPGDSLQLDGFRKKENAIWSYVLHPLPPGCASIPAKGVAASSSIAAVATAVKRAPGMSGTESKTKTPGADKTSTPSTNARRQAAATSTATARAPSTPDSSKPFGATSAVTRGVWKDTAATAGPTGYPPLVPSEPVAAARKASASAVSGIPSTPADAVLARGKQGPAVGSKSEGSGGGLSASDTGRDGASPGEGDTVKKKLHMGSSARGGGSNLVSMSPSQGQSPAAVAVTPPSTSGGSAELTPSKRTRAQVEKDETRGSSLDSPPAKLPRQAAAPQSTDDDSSAAVTPRERAARLTRHDAGGTGEAGTVTVTDERWKAGDIVELEARTSKGENKLGGVARVVSVFDDNTYRVKLTLGGAAATRVPAHLLHRYVPPAALTSRATRNSATATGATTGTTRRDSIPSPSASSSASASPPRRSPPPRRCPPGSASPLVANRKRSRRIAADKSASGSDREDVANAPATSATAVSATAVRGAEPPSGETAAQPGDRARVLFDDTDWYMGTVVAVHGAGEVTVRFDDGSEDLVTLSLGDAETCDDTALTPSATEVRQAALATSRGAANAGVSASGNRKGRAPLRASSRIAAVKSVARALGAHGRVLEEGEGNMLTEGRAKALLDTVPQKLVGLKYRESEPGYGGWWETVVMEVSDERAEGGDKAGARWPKAVVVRQVDPTLAEAGKGESDGASQEVDGKNDSDKEGEGNDLDDEQEEGKFTFRRKVSTLLSRLRVWDKHQKSSSTTSSSGSSSAGSGSAVDDARTARSAAGQSASSTAPKVPLRSSSRPKKQTAKALALSAPAPAPARSLSPPPPPTTTTTTTTFAPVPTKAAATTRARAAAAPVRTPADRSKTGTAASITNSAVKLSGGAARTSISQPVSRREEVVEPKPAESRSVDTTPTAVVWRPQPPTLTPKVTPAPKAALSPQAAPAPAVAVTTGKVGEGDDGGDGDGKIATAGAAGEEAEKKPTAAKLKMMAKKEAATLKRQEAEERERPTCPMCGCVFYATESPEAVDAHLNACNRKAAEAEAAEEEAVQAGAATLSTPGVSMLSQSYAGSATVLGSERLASTSISTSPGAITRVTTSSLTPKSVSGGLLIGIRSGDLEVPLCTVEELCSRGFRPRAALCDRVMQEILASRCNVATNYLARIMRGSLQAFPECWQPLNWGRFEEALQQLAAHSDPLALSALSAYIDIVLDGVQAYRLRRRKSTTAATGTATAMVKSRAMPRLFIGAGGDRDGRSALKKCAKWAAKAWAKRGAEVFAGNEVETRVCLSMSRAVTQALEAFRSVGVGRSAGSASRLDVEGCQLVVAEMQAHCGGTVDGDVEMGAKCQAGMLRSLASTPFFQTLVGVLSQSMSSEKEGVEVERLKDYVKQMSGVPVGVGRIGGRGQGKIEMSGTAMLLADMAR